MWTRFVMAFYTGQSGLLLVAYVILTFLAHVFYEAQPRRRLQLLRMTRPDSIVWSRRC